MTLSDKKRNKVLGLYDKYEKNPRAKLEKKLLKYFSEQRIRLYKHFSEYDDKQSTKSEEDADSESEKLLDTYSFDDEEKLLLKVIYPSLVLSGEIGNELANIILYANEEDFKVFSMIEPKYLEFLNEYGTEQSKFITNTTRNEAKKILVDGVEKGLSYKDMAKNLSKHLGDLSVGRAENIATTEVHTSFMTARSLNAKVAGFKEKAWISSKDASVRSTHQVYDKLGWVDIDYKYGGVMLYAGDPKGSVKELARCRCDMLYR